MLANQKYSSKKNGREILGVAKRGSRWRFVEQAFSQYFQ
jgi:hypothetical protein